MLEQTIFNKIPNQAALKAMDAAMLRSRTIANNVANVNTSGYKRLDVSFEDELRTALNRTRLKGAKTTSGHMDLGRKDISRVSPDVYKPVDPTMASGVNNVDIDIEMAKLAETQVMFNYAARFVRGGFSKLNAAIQAKSIPGR
jgi:flagellar basal-body rod protein FlgB